MWVGKMQPVFLFPTAMEAAPLRALRPDLDVRICGVGVVETARYVARMLCEESPEQVLLCGIAGAYSEWEVGAVVQVTTERVAGLPAQYAAEYQASLRIDGVAEAVSNTVTSVGTVADGATVENMEGAAVFALCEEFGVCCAEIRAISNRVGAPRDEWRIDLALDNLTETILAILDIETEEI